MTEITDEKKREAMDALGRALDVAMYQTLAASIPACGAFGAIAQDLDFAFPILTAALSPAPQALAGEAEWSPTGDEQASWYARMSDEDRRIANAIMREGCAEHARLTRALRDAEIASGIDIATLRARVAELEARLGEDGAEWREKAAGVASEIIQNSTPPASQEGQADG